MMPIGLLLLTLVGFISSAQSLQCKSCDSTIGWEDCQSKIILEDCGLITSKHSNHVHQCFQLEERHPATNSVIYRQGCTGDPMFCAERSQVTMEQCSLCTDDNASSECTSMVHRVKKTQDGKMVDVVDTIHFQRTQGDAKVITPGEAANSSIEIDVASRKNGTDVVNTVSVELKNKQTTKKTETQDPLSKPVESTSTTVESVTTSSAPKITTPRSACNRNLKKAAVSTEEEQGLQTVEPEKTETSTSSTIGPQGPILATGPPEANSFGLANEAETWVVGLLVVASFLVLGV